MEGIRFTRNRQNTRSFGMFLAGNPSRPLAAGRHCSSQVTPPWVFRFQIRTVLFEIQIPQKFVKPEGQIIDRIQPMLHFCTCYQSKYREYS